MSQPPYPGQGPGYVPGTGPGYTPAPGYGQPPRRGKPWWVWMLFGCGGCALIVAVAATILGVGAFNTYKSAMQDVGPVTAASVQQSLGADVPVYPNAQLDLDSTKILITSLRVGEKLAGKPRGAIFGGGALYRTPDAAQKVLGFYDREMKQAGWQSIRSQDTSFQQQHQFQKSGGIAIIQTQKDPASGGTQLTIMRGGSDLAKLKSQSGSQAP